MIVVVVETQRVYSHGDDGMAKIEIIPQKFTDGANFNKFLKYLPYHNYLNDKIKILRVTEKKDGEVKEIDKKPWEDKLKAVISKMNEPEETIFDKYEKKSKDYDSLLERLEALEAKDKPKVESDEKSFDDLTKEELTEEYKEKFGKRPYGGWKKDVLIEKLKD